MQCADLSSPTRDWTCAPGVEAWRPNHWTTRDVPQLPFNSVNSVTLQLIFCFVFKCCGGQTTFPLRVHGLFSGENGLKFNITVCIWGLWVIVIKCSESENAALHSKVNGVDTAGLFDFSSVQFSRSVVSDSLRPHELQHARPPCPSPTPGVHSDSRPSSQWCHPAISSTVVPFSSCPPVPPSIRVFSNESTLRMRWPKYWSFIWGWANGAVLDFIFQLSDFSRKTNGFLNEFPEKMTKCE